MPRQDNSYILRTWWSKDLHTLQGQSTIGHVIGQYDCKY
jgi:hypothetical protein